MPTAEHWEADWIPKAGFPLARGWFRQIDEVYNPILYSKSLDAATYDAWLRSAAVRYVLLTSTAPLDWDGGPREKQIVQSRAAGLKLVFQSKDWLIYELPHATPLLTGPGHPVVTTFGHTVTSGRVFSAGRYLLREHYNPYWHLRGRGLRRARAESDDDPRPLRA